MTLPMILAPLFVLVLMTFVIGFTLAGVRGPLLTRGEVRPEAISLRQPNWPPRALQVGYSFQNQFELPMLFYVVCLTLHVTAGASSMAVLVAWIYVGLRVVHSLIHLSYNRVVHRLSAFALGNVALVVLWSMAAIHIAGTAP